MMIIQLSLLISMLWKDLHKKISQPKVVLPIHPNNSVVAHTVKTKVSVFLLLKVLVANAQMDTLVFNVKSHPSSFFQLLTNANQAHVKMVVPVIFDKVHSVAHAPLDSVVSAVKLTWLLQTHATTTHVKIKEPVKSLVLISSVVFAQLVSLAFVVNNVSVILIHVYMVVSVWLLEIPFNVNAHHNILVDAANF